MAAFGARAPATRANRSADVAHEQCHDQVADLVESLDGTAARPILATIKIDCQFTTLSLCQYLSETNKHEDGES